MKLKLSKAPILIFLDWIKEFHVHIDASIQAIITILAHPNEGKIDHPIYFSSQKIVDAKKNYIITEKEALAMVYALQKLYHFC